MGVSQILHGTVLSLVSINLLILIILNLKDKYFPRIFVLYYYLKFKLYDIKMINYISFVYICLFYIISRGDIYLLMVNEVLLLNFEFFSSWLSNFCNENMVLSSHDNGGTEYTWISENPGTPGGEGSSGGGRGRGPQPPHNPDDLFALQGPHDENNEEANNNPRRSRYSRFGSYTEVTYNDNDRCSRCDITERERSLISAELDRVLYQNKYTNNVPTIGQSWLLDNFDMREKFKNHARHADPLRTERNLSLARLNSPSINTQKTLVITKPLTNAFRQRLDTPNE